MYYPQSKFRDPNNPAVISAIVYAIDHSLWTSCLQHKTWDRHGLSTNARMAEPDGTFFVIDESEPGTITGRSPHHKHEGEYWIECCGFAAIQTRMAIARRKSPIAKKEKE